MKDINKLIPLPYTYNFKTSTQLMHGLMDISYTNDIKFASFDITNMYTNIPTQDLIDIVNHLCIYNNIDTIIQTELQKMCNIVITQN